jgi:hypothetical protein
VIVKSYSGNGLDTVRRRPFEFLLSRSAHYTRPYNRSIISINLRATDSGISSTSVAAIGALRAVGRYMAGLVIGVVAYTSPRRSRSGRGYGRRVGGRLGGTIEVRVVTLNMTLLIIGVTSSRAIITTEKRGYYGGSVGRKGVILLVRRSGG